MRNRTASALLFLWSASACGSDSPGGGSEVSGGRDGSFPSVATDAAGTDAAVHARNDAHASPDVAHVFTDANTSPDAAEARADANAPGDAGTGVAADAPKVASALTVDVDGKTFVASRFATDFQSGNGSNVFRVTATLSPTEWVRLVVAVPVGTTSAAGVTCKALAPNGNIMQMAAGTETTAYQNAALPPSSPWDCSATFTTIPSNGVGRLVGTFAGTLKEHGGRDDARPLSLTNGSLDVAFP